MNTKSKVAGKSYFLALALAAWKGKETGSRARARAGTLVLTAPELPDWWPNEPEFAGMVPREDQEKDMEVLIAEWPNSPVAGDTDYLTFQWRPQGALDWQDAQPRIPIPGPLDSSSFPMPLQLSQNVFKQEGNFELRYVVLPDAGSLTESFITPFIIDKTPPHHNQSPGVPTFGDPAVISDGITAEYLATNGGVDIVIPPYTDTQPGDSVEIYVFNRNTQPTQPAHRAVLDASLTVKVPTDAFDGLHDGMIYLYYRLLDKVTNRGPTSDNAETGLFIQPLPVPPLAAPLVPRIDNDNVLGLDDVLAGEDLVKVKLYGNWLERDVVELTWGTATVHATHEVLSAEDPMTLNVPYKSILAPAYGVATGPIDTVLSYVVRRGNKTFASDPTTIKVDFFVPGPVNPDRPKPINPLLPQVTVKGTGSNPTENVLNDDDAGKPVNVTVDLYDPIGPGEQAILYWYSLDNQVGILNPVAGTPGDEYTFTVAWDDIKDLPSATDIPVLYTVGLVNGNGNVESCVPTLVNVSAALPIKLATPTFPDVQEAADGSPILNCGSFIGDDQHVVIEVPSNAPLLTGGEELTFTWECFTDKLGMDPAGTPQETKHTLTADEAANGYRFNTGSFEEYIKPVDRNGSIRLTYVSATTPVMQGEVLIRAAAKDAFDFCRPNPRRSSRAGGCGCS